ncbi:hypothetical protein MWU76_16160 [Gelidibacter sp. F2691]|nr:hypothetical protein [Gelidibacter sp. F2691]
MRVLIMATVAIVSLAGCQTTTTQQVAAKQVPPQCRSAVAGKIGTLDREIARLKAEVDRGYQTPNSPVKVANPLKLCKGVVPFVSVCLPTPEPKSTLPTFTEHKQSKADLKTRWAEREALLSENPNCE